LFAVGRIIRTGKQGCTIRAATVGIAPDFEAPSERGKPGKISVTSAARLPGLSREARQRLRRRREANSQEARQNDKPANSSDYPEMRRGVTNGIAIDPHQHPPQSEQTHAPMYELVHYVRGLMGTPLNKNRGLIRFHRRGAFRQHIFEVAMVSQSDSQQ
jgi:hypothetical protein